MPGALAFAKDWQSLNAIKGFLMNFVLRVKHLGFFIFKECLLSYMYIKTIYCNDCLKKTKHYNFPTTYAKTTFVRYYPYETQQGHNRVQSTLTIVENQKPTLIEHSRIYWNNLFKRLFA